MRIFHAPAVFVTGLVASSVLLAQAKPAPSDPPHASAHQAQVSAADDQVQHFSPTLVDESLPPCDDFYKYACNKWMTANPIPPDQMFWGTVSGLVLFNDNLTRETMEAASVNRSPGDGNRQKIGDYWLACMDESGIEASGTKPLQPEFSRINALRSPKEITLEIARLHHLFAAPWQPADNQAFAALFGFSGQKDYDDTSKVVAHIDQGGLSLPNRDFYLKSDEKSKELLAKYQNHVQKMFELAGETESQATADANAVLELETALAQAQMDNIRRRDPKNINNKMSLAELRELAPAIDWNAYLKAVNAPPSPHYIVTSPDFMRTISKLLKELPIDRWRAYLRWQLIHGAAPSMHRAMVDENFMFFSRTLVGVAQQQPRWRICVRSADRDLGDALGREYVERAFPSANKERSLQMVNSIEQAMRRNIQGSDWMSPVTKEQAIAKLNGVENKIGYPSRWLDYSSVKITPGSYFDNVTQSASFRFERSVAKIGKVVDRSEWNMTPTTINAYCDAQLNTINFPAGILQPPFFDATKDDSVNYGAIGMVIGHELTHAFDDQGRKFDAQGNLRDWWTAADSGKYQERGKCIAAQYTQDIPEAGAGVKQNGSLTQGEDIADNGGLRLALYALEDALKDQGKSLDDKGPDGWTYRQRFFLSFAFSWCANLRPEFMRWFVTSNPHSLWKYRVNNVVSNMPEFQRAFACKAGQPMVRENACRVW
jgi:putative endopeptidase